MVEQTEEGGSGRGCVPKKMQKKSENNTEISLKVKPTKRHINGDLACLRMCKGYKTGKGREIREWMDKNGLQLILEEAHTK